MHDPWDVVATRHSDQYVSCMKISGVPLLPPVLSKECRKEMQYYKILALEVEKRISHLKNLVVDIQSEFDESLTPCDETEDEVCNKITSEENNVTEVCPNEKEKDSCDTDLVPNGYESMRSDITVIDNSDNSPVLSSPKLVIDVIGDLFKGALKSADGSDKKIDQKEEDKPERDYDCLLPKPIKETKIEMTKNELENLQTVDNYKPGVVKVQVRTPIKFQAVNNTTPRRNGPASLINSKSFDDIHSELSVLPKLTRQRSYTILKPSPALLAHLEVQSLNSGVEMSSISMSESCSNITWLTKKRRSWDLETAKVKWSSMASELNKGVKKNNVQKRTHTARPNVRAQSAQKPLRARSTTQERNKKNNTPSSHFNNNSSTNNSVQKPALKTTHAKPAQRPVEVKPEQPNKPLEKLNEAKPEQLNKSLAKPIEPKPELLNQTSSPISSKNSSLDSDSTELGFTAKLSMITSENSSSPSPIKSNGSSTPKEDPSECIRDLYDKIRNQQIVRMASLVEKQNKEKQLLQQVFEEQNALFYKQLKTICPTSPNKIKEAWSEKTLTKDSSPVRLSNIINTGSTPQANPTVISSVLNDSQNYIQKTDEALKKSRSVLKTSQVSASKMKPKSAEYTSSPYALSQLRPKTTASSIPRRDDKLTRTVTDSTTRPSHSPRRRLSSNSSQSSRDFEPILTDRTNDTMADLNFTLPNDDNADFYSDALYRDTTFIVNDGRRDNSSAKSKAPLSPTKIYPMGRIARSGSVDSNTDGSQTLRAYSVQSSKYSEPKSMRKLFTDRPTGLKELEAASRIVAYAKGYLVRRLLRTERVQTTVQTIRDALICALQLHQDREGIRGADVDLHRRLIQQITAACYSLHETFIVSSPKERCALISQDRDRQRALEEKQMSGSYSAPKSLSTPTRRIGKRKSDIMSHSHSGVFALPGRSSRLAPAAMTQSSHEMYCSEDKSLRPSSKKSVAASKELHSRRPWR